MIARIMNLVHKELLHFARDRVLTPLLLFGPLSELILIGIATSSNIEHLPTVVLNQDTGKQGAALVQMIDASPVFDLNEVDSEAQARDKLADAKITAAFIIPEDFSQALANPLEARTTRVELLLDGADTFAAEAAHFGAEEVIDTFAGLVSMGWLNEAGVEITEFEEPTIRVLYNEKLKKSFYEMPAEMEPGWPMISFPVADSFLQRSTIASRSSGVSPGKPAMKYTLTRFQPAS